MTGARSSPDPLVATALFSWEEGTARLGESPALERTRRRIVAAVQEELRRRVGSTFTVADLAGAYQTASSWYLELAARLAPKEPEAWDPAVALDAAFGVYMRRATDASR